MKAVVTGANGFVGAAVCKQLQQAGYEVLAVVRSENSDTSRLSSCSTLRYIFCDMNNYVSLPEKIPDRDISIFFHFAWDGVAGTSRFDDTQQLKNVQYSCDAIRACKKMDCNRFVFSASIMEYEVQNMMKQEIPLPGSTIYSTAKLTADYMLRAIGNSVGVSFIRGLISNIYGPGETNERLIITSIQKMIRGEYCTFSSGAQMYDFIYIDDAAKAFVAIGEKGINNRTYYIGSLNPRPLKDYLLQMRDCVAPDSEIGLGALLDPCISLTYQEFDIGAVKKDTGFEPQVNFRDGIKRTVEWVRHLNSN